MNRFLIALSFCFFLLFPEACFAQSTAEEWVDAGHAKYVEYQYDQAVSAYKQALKIEANNFDAHFFIGVCRYAQQKYSEASEYFENAAQIDSTQNDALPFYRAECRFFEEKYAESIPLYKRFLQISHANEYLVFRARQQVRNAEFAESVPISLGAPKAEVLLDGINSLYDDFNPWLCKGDSILFFCSDRPVSNQASRGGVRSSNSDIYLSFNTDSGWSNPEPLPTNINSATNEKEVCATPDGKMIAFGRHPSMPTDGHFDCNIWYAYRTTTGWTPPSPFPPNINSAFCDSWPSLSDDGQALIFASDRPGGMGGYDLWLCNFESGSWSEAQNLGPSINTPGDELDPCWTAKGQWLFFSSDGHPGFGGFDSFKSQRNGKSWSQPVNLGRGINTVVNDFDLYVSPTGKQVWSNRITNALAGQPDLIMWLNLNLLPDLGR